MAQSMCKNMFSRYIFMFLKYRFIALKCLF
nr:MAG TPA: hypothetical protein [Caudoviricetes sp.]